MNLHTSLVGVDLGTANTIILDNQRVWLREPSILAIDARSSQVIALGSQAWAMHEKTPPFLHTIKPLRDGVIADYSSAEKMLAGFIRQSAIHHRQLGKKIFVISIPFDTTEVEKRAVTDSAQAAGASEVFMIHEPVAAAIGIGWSIFQPQGHMLIDLGGGTTEVAVVSYGQVVCNQSMRLGGFTLDREIVSGVRRHHNMHISERMAERMKWEIGAAQVDSLENSKMDIVGRDLATGLPKCISITSAEVAFYMDRVLGQIETGLLKTLELCPPELAGDIYQEGIVITGGGAQLRGLVDRWEKRLKIPVQLAVEPLNSVQIGLNYVLNHMGECQSLLFK
ncbi:MAG: rod shape-determining protein [Spirosomataceae bacterium]